MEAFYWTLPLPRAIDISQVAVKASDNPRSPGSVLKYQPIMTAMKRNRADVHISCY